MGKQRRDTPGTMTKRGDAFPMTIEMRWHCGACDERGPWVDRPDSTGQPLSIVVLRRFEAHLAERHPDYATDEVLLPDEPDLAMHDHRYAQRDLWVACRDLGVLLPESRNGALRCTYGIWQGSDSSPVCPSSAWAIAPKSSGEWLGDAVCVSHGAAYWYPGLRRRSAAHPDDIKEAGDG